MDLWKAMLQLYPNADPHRDYSLVDDGTGPRIEYFNPALGPRPTQAQIDAAIVAYDAAETIRQQDAAALRALLIQTAQSAVGVAFNQLTAAQVRSLVAILLHKEGALNGQGIVQPLNTWVR